MTTARILCYRPDWDKHILDNAITSWTYLWNPKIWKHSKLKCGHIDIWLPHEEYGFSNEYGYCGNCITYTMRYANGKNGIVKRHAKLVLKNPHRWFYFEVEIEDLTAACQWIYNTVKNNEGYDTKAINSFFWFKRFHDESKYICSEYGYEFICKFCFTKSDYFLFDKTAVPSPIKLAYWLWKEEGIVPVDLKTGLLLNL